MKEITAVYYGQVELIPGIVCDGYVLDDDSAVMSERGTADLLQMDHKALKRLGINWPPKSLKPFVDSDVNVGTTEPPKVNKPFVSKGLSVGTTLVEVVAKNSPHKGRKIVVYNSQQA
jgi:hypothetical protein